MKFNLSLKPKTLKSHAIKMGLLLGLFSSPLAHAQQFQAAADSCQKQPVLVHLVTAQGLGIDTGERKLPTVCVTGAPYSVDHASELEFIKTYNLILETAPYEMNRFARKLNYRHTKFIVTIPKFINETETPIKTCSSTDYLQEGFDYCLLIPLGTPKKIFESSLYKKDQNHEALISSNMIDVLTAALSQSVNTSDLVTVGTSSWGDQTVSQISDQQIKTLRLNGIEYLRKQNTRSLKKEFISPQ
jgi:hypothetical protein